jgi:hypothetical protein
LRHGSAVRLRVCGSGDLCRGGDHAADARLVVGAIVSRMTGGVASVVAAVVCVADGKEQRPHHGYGGPVDLTPASRVGGQLGGTPQADVASRVQLRVCPRDLEDNGAGL